MTNSDNANLNEKNQASTDTDSQTDTQINKPSVSESEIKKQQQAIDEKVEKMPKEFGGRPKDKGLEPTRYGDWEFKGRCIDF